MDCVYYVACLQLKLLYAKPSGHMHTQNNQQYKIPLLLSGYYYSDCYYYVREDNFSPMSTAAVTLAWFPNNNNVTQTFHRSKSDQNITLAGKEGVFGNVFFERLEHLLHATLRYEEGVFTLVPPNSTFL